MAKGSGTSGTAATDIPEQLKQLIKLIAMHNPYTTGKPGDMDFLVMPPTATSPEYSQFHVELDGDYPGDWSFKGQPQKINKVLRIQYRAKATAKNAQGNAHPEGDYWMSAYLLIGFEDGSA